jgi:hypothetical protein
MVYCIPETQMAPPNGGDMQNIQMFVRVLAELIVLQFVENRWLKEGMPTRRFKQQPSTQMRGVLHCSSMETTSTNLHQLLHLPHQDGRKARTKPRESNDVGLAIVHQTIGTTGFILDTARRRKKLIAFENISYITSCCSKSL